MTNARRDGDERFDDAIIRDDVVGSPISPKTSSTYSASPRSPWLRARIVSSTPAFRRDGTRITFDGKPAHRIAFDFIDCDGGADALVVIGSTRTPSGALSRWGSLALSAFRNCELPLRVNPEAVVGLKFDVALSLDGRVDRWRTPDMRRHAQAAALKGAS
jgi:hypothetical protein